MSTLYYVPILHTLEEVGDVKYVLERMDPSAPPLQLTEEMKRNIMSYVRQAAILNQAAVAYWQSLLVSLPDFLIQEGVLDEDRYAIKKLSLYLDSFCQGMSWEECREAAGKSSIMCGLLDSLMHNGAELCPTEDNLRRQTFMKAFGVVYRKGLSTKLPLFKGRDRWIAKTIASGLGNEGTGILFMGAIHDVPKFLPDSLTLKIFHRGDVISREAMQLLAERGLGGSYLLREDDFGHKPKIGLAAEA